MLTKVRGIYPSYIRLFFLALFVPLFYVVCVWVFEAQLVSVLATSAVTAVLLVFVLSGVFPTVFIANVAKRFKVSYRAENVTDVSSRTVTNKWMSGIAVTTLFFRFSDTTDKLSLTDTRNPFLPLRSGYRQREIDAIIEWLSYVPESSTGYEHVEHLKQMLAVKNSEQ